MFNTVFNQNTCIIMLTPYDLILNLTRSTLLFNLTILLLNTTCPVLANSVDTDQLASSEANWSGSALFVINYVNFYQKPGSAGLGGSVGCAVRLETRRSRVQPPPRSATFFRGDWSWNIFYGHSLPSADSRRAVVSFWRKNVHNTG